MSFNRDQQQRFSIRKLTVGAASVLIGIFFMSTAANEVHADAAPASEVSATAKQDQAAKSEQAANNDQAKAAVKATDQAKQSAKTEQTAPKAAAQTDTQKAATQEVDPNATENKSIKATAKFTNPGQDGQLTDISDPNFKDLQATITVTNTDNKTHQAYVGIYLPLMYAKPNDSAHKVKVLLDGPIDLSAWKGATAIYFDANNTMITNQDYSKATQVNVFGALDGSVDLHVNLKLANEDQIKKDLTDVMDIHAAVEVNNYMNRWTYVMAQPGVENTRGLWVYNKSSQANTYITMVDTVAINNLQKLYNSKQKWTPVYMIETGTDTSRKYVMAPKEVLDAIKSTLNPNEVSYQNYRAYNKSNKLYVGGTYKINLEPAFSDIHNLGYTVNIMPSGNQIWQTYDYATLPSHPNWVLPAQGTGMSDSELATWESPIYFEIQKVFTTHDVKITTSQDWSSLDNLDSAHVYYSDKMSMNKVAEHDLKAENRYTYDLLDSNGKVVYSSADLANGTKTKLAAGNYQVVYHYTIDPSHIVNKTANVVVTGNSTPEPNPNPQPNPEPQPNPQPEPQPEPQPNPQPEPQPEPKPNPQPNPQPEPKPNPQPTPEKPVVPSKGNGKQAVVAAKPAATPNAKTAAKEATLPQTGQSKSSAGVFGLAIAALAGAFGLAADRKLKN